MNDGNPSLLGNLWGWLTNASTIHVQNPEVASKMFQHSDNHSIDNVMEAHTVAELEFCYNDFASWESDFQKLPYLRDDAYLVPNYKEKPQNFSYEEFLKALVAFKLTMEQSIDMQPAAWAHEEIMPEDFFNLETALFTPYVQKAVIPTGSTVSFHGDLHGDAQSLVKYIRKLNDDEYMDGFRIIKDDFYMVFLGDYVDRGSYGAEVIYTILRLKIANPENVFMVRGNHEDKLINRAYGFAGELKAKFPQAKQDLIYNMYNMLPVALYIGSGSDAIDFIECCHGGKEIGFIPSTSFLCDTHIKYERIFSLERKSNMQLLLSKISLSPDIAISPENIARGTNERIYLTDKRSFETGDLGYLWSDYIIEKNPQYKNKKYMIARGDRSYLYSKALVTAINTHINSLIVPHKVVANFRAHQHDYDEKGMMGLILDREGKHPESKGVAKLWRTKKKQDAELWNNIICTFNVSPDSPYGADEKTGFEFDTYALLKMGSHYPDDWQLHVIRNTIFNNHK